MASPYSSLSTMVLLLLAFLPATILSQSIGSESSPAGPTVAECGPRLLPLAPCAPFVQGAAVSPAPSCCDNLKQQYNQQPNCLCLVLNGTVLNTLPINTTLALQLPNICNIQVDYSLCSGSGVCTPTTSPAAQVSFGTKSNSTNATIAAAPMATVSPRPRTTIMGFGYHQTAGIAMKLKIDGQLVVLLVVAIAIQFTSILS